MRSLEAPFILFLKMGVLISKERKNGSGGLAYNNFSFWGRIDLY